MNANGPNAMRKGGLRTTDGKGPEGALGDVEDEGENGGGVCSIDEIKEARPRFLKEENIMDKMGRRPWEEGYDETTLYISPEDWKKFTPAMRQYWTIKQNNLEKILFFKLGKFYEIFYTDAIICNRILDLAWMGAATRLHVGFPEKACDNYVGILVNHGFKVAVIEQTETPK